MKKVWNKTTKEIFIKKANIVHKNKFNYSSVEYINSKTKIKIICNVHGIFEQLPVNHLQGQNCPKCAQKSRNKKLQYTNEIFIKKSIEVHGNKYDYSLITYIDSISKIKIICKKHGEFLQIPHDHLSGKGCKNCAIENRANHDRKTKKEFIKLAIKCHGNKFDYSSVEYINSKTKIKIKCLKHGIFQQKPENHLNGQGCKKCANEGLSYTTDIFIEKAIKIHKNLYDYKLVNYKGSQKKVKIICNRCKKIFKQTTGAHLEGQGCSFCVRGHISKIETKWLDYLKVSEKFRQKLISINDKNYRVDAYDPTINTIYEFFGDFWHGNPNKYKPEDINKVNKKTFGQLYQETIIKINNLKEAGYNVIYIWEEEFVKLCGNKKIKLLYSKSSEE